MYGYFKNLIRNARKWLHKKRDNEEERLEEMVGPPGAWKKSRDFQIYFLKSKGLQPHHTVLDIGCGPLRGGIPLIRYLSKGNYTGIDIRPEVIAEAQEQIGKEGLTNKTPNVFTSKSFGRDELAHQQFDYIWCFQVLYHLQDDLADSCLQQISKFLRPSSVCLANVNIFGEQGQWKEFPYVKRPLDFYESIATKYSMTLTNLGQQCEFGYTLNVPGRFNNILEFRKI